MQYVFVKNLLERPYKLTIIMFDFMLKIESDESNFFNETIFFVRFDVLLNRVNKDFKRWFFRKNMFSENIS